MPWPATGLEGYRPADVVEALQRVEAECPEVEASNAVLDCGEFPCLVFVPLEFSLDATPPGLNDCGAWPYPAGGGGDLITDRDGIVRGYTVYPALPDESWQSNEEIKRRLEYRWASYEKDAGEMESAKP